MQRWAALGLVTGLCCPLLADAANWRMTPRVSTTQTWSDNIEQAPAATERHDFVSQLTSGISVAGRGSRLRLNFDYQATAVRYARDTASFRVDHRLQGNGNAELYEDHLFLDFSSTVSPQNTDNRGRLSSDTVTANDNRETAVVVQASPYWQQRFGRYADATLRYRGGILQNETASDTDLHELSLVVNSGVEFPQFPWTLQARFRREENNQNGTETSTNTFKSVNGSVRHQFDRQYGVRVRAGYSQDDVVSSQGEADSLTWAVTGLWTPTPRTEFEAGVEKQSFGNSFLLNASHRMRRAVFTLDYDESRTTSASRQFDRQLFSLTDAFGDPIPNPGLQQVDVPTDDPSLREETLISRRFAGSVSIRGRRTRGSLRVTHERRDYELSGDDETIISARASASRTLSRDSSVNMGADWQSSDFSSGRTDNRYGFNMGYNKSLSSDLNASLTYRFTRNSSDITINEYTENRVAATVTMLF